MSPTASNILETWWPQGEAFFTGALDRLADDDLDGPSLLPGWQRRTVVAHVARNADALTNLLTWARTGEEMPMYASPEARQAGIAATAALPARELRDDLAVAAANLRQATLSLPPDAWDHEIRTAQGRTVPATEVSWMRCREVWVHAVDLAADVGFGDEPDDVTVALVDDVMLSWQRREVTPDVTFVTPSRTWGAGTRSVQGDVAQLAAYLTGRSDGADLSTSDGLPDLPPWL